MGQLTITAANLAFLAIIADAALSDLRRLRIPNRDSVLLVATFLIAAFVAASGMWAEVLPHLAAGLAVFVVGAALFALGIWGGGDAKLLAAVAVWTGFAGLARLLLVMALVGGALALVVLVLRRAKSSRRCAVAGHVPYGIAIGAGAVDWWARAVLPQIAGYLAS